MSRRSCSRCQVLDNDAVSHESTWPDQSATRTDLIRERSEEPQSSWLTRHLGKADTLTKAPDPEICRGCARWVALPSTILPHVTRRFTWIERRFAFTDDRIKQPLTLE